MNRSANFSDLIGKTLVKVDGGIGDDVIEFGCTDGTRYRMFHWQDCCERVSVEDIAGDIADIIGSPILVAEESTGGENPPGVTKEWQDSFTWTFYKIDTAKGGVTIRWYGESNGYYSERVDFERVD